MKEKIDVQKPDDLGLDISDLRYFLVMLLFSAVVFFLLISQRLTNTFDGLWNNTWFFGGYWQVVTGRWLWPVIDVLRFGIQTEPFNSLLTLSMSALAVTLLRKFFTEKDSVVTYLRHEPHALPPERKTKMSSQTPATESDMTAVFQ